MKSIVTTYEPQGNTCEVPLIGSEEGSSMDQVGSVNDHVQMSVQQIATQMGVSSRTVYSHIDREGWEKVEGARGRVFYMVPANYIEEYKRSTEQINEASVQDHANDSQLPIAPSLNGSVNSSQLDMNFSDRLIDEIKRAHEEALKSKDQIIEELRERNAAMERELRERILKLEEDKTVMTRQIEAGNTAMVTMRDAKRMQEEPEKNRLDEENKRLQRELEEAKKVKEEISWMDRLNPFKKL